MGAGILAYKAYVRTTLQRIWVDRTLQAIRSSSQAPLLSNAFPDIRPSSMLSSILRTPTDSDGLVAARSICRLRLCLLTLGAKGDRPSRARVVQCVACGRPTVSPLAHTLLRCESWAGFRHPWRCGREHHCRTFCACSRHLPASASLPRWQWLLRAMLKLSGLPGQVH